MAKHYNLQEREGLIVRVYESGLVMDDETGRILKTPPGTASGPLDKKWFE